ncbi:DUF692 domain-containing protein [Psychromonas sp. MME2]|uniref:MNIO family bufferin maturase n=1 Tax=Psychromonas sp. MME2 TaxID=3231033 RepID=UPI00339C311C
MKKINKSAFGIGLRPIHHQALMTEQPSLGFVEIHSENYFNAHSKNHYYLEQAASLYPLSFHGIGLSLGSAEAISINHLQNLKQLVDRFQPALVSDHLSWSSLQGTYFNNLLPIPYTNDSLSYFVNNVNQVQDYLQREIIIENPSSYLQYLDGDFSEAEFINEIAEQTGCGILLDINNVFVSATNHQFSAEKYLHAINHSKVEEIHLAGFTKKEIQGSTILIDTHSTFVSPDVWALYELYIKKTKTEAVSLIEWDGESPV